MKRIILLSIFILATLMLRAQEEQEIILKHTDKNKIYHNSLITENAKFQSKYKNIFDFYKANSKYKIVEKEEPSNTTYFNIYIGKNGEIYDYEIIKSLGDKYDIEVKRLINIMPKWKPARKDNKGIQVVDFQKITFMPKR